MSAQENGGWSYKGWYDQNKKDLSNKRKDRYKTDAEYRDKIIQRNREYRAKKRNPDLVSGATAEPGVPGRKRRPVQATVRVHGQLVICWVVHVGSFARAIGRSVATVHAWEKSGLLPRTPIVHRTASKAERLYTDEMIKSVEAAISRRNGQVSLSDRSFTDEIIQAWNNAGLDMTGE